MATTNEIPADYVPPESESESESNTEVTEVVQDIEHKMYNDNQRLHRLLSKYKIRNARSETSLHYMKLTANNEHTDKIKAWENIQKHKDFIKEKQEMIKYQKNQMYRIITIGSILFFVNSIQVYFYMKNIILYFFS